MYKQCIHGNCELDALEIDPHCILHYGGKDPSHVEEFKATIEKLIKTGYNHFHQIQFPSGYNSFPEKIELNKASFIDCTFDSGFDFLNTKFVGVTTFERNRFASDVRFLTCEIQEDFYMRGNSYRKQLFFSHLKTIAERNKIVIQDLSGFSPSNVPNNLLFDSCNLINTKLILKSMILKSATWRFVDNNFISSKLKIDNLDLTGQVEFRGNVTPGNIFRASEVNIVDTTFSGHEVFFGRGNNID